MEKDTRERILDSAARIIHRDGLARATTRQIARAAGCSEALLYKYFPDKQEIFLRVLTERVPRIASPDELVGTATVEHNLATLVEQLLGFYVQGFPMAASIFGDVELLAAHREAMRARGAGPRGPSLLVGGYLDAEKDAGRLPSGLDSGTLARVIVGTALHEAFLAAFDGLDAVPDAPGVARRVVAVLRLE